MKKKILIGSSLVLVVVLLISLFLILGGKEEDPKAKLEDYSHVNVESLKTNETEKLSLNTINVLNARIRNGYLEGIIFNNSEKNYEVLDIKVILLNKKQNKLDEISFQFNDFLAYEERDMFYPIQKDLSNAYYIYVEM